jgi:hypothetical protein
MCLFVLNVLNKGLVDWRDEKVQIVIFQKFQIFVLNFQKLRKFTIIHLKSDLVQNFINFLEDLGSLFEQIILIKILNSLNESTLGSFLSPINLSDQIVNNF